MPARASTTRSPATCRRGRRSAAAAGLWVARQVTSALELLRPDAGGLTVRLWS